MKINALRGRVLVDDITRGERMVGRIIIPSDDGSQAGVRTRWCRVYSVGSDIKTVKAGEWILVEHGNWTRGMTIRDDNNEDVTFWDIKWPEGALAVADAKPSDDSWSGESVVKSEKLER